jgi:hypothetical protein
MEESQLTTGTAFETKKRKAESLPLLNINDMPVN